MRQKQKGRVEKMDRPRSRGGEGRRSEKNDAAKEMRKWRGN